ncbi:MAG: ABC transporter ATP-binding protein [Euryarchaeota archaeon]|nr:ABC transporter ATP-binding protein [Euryarchaeota archaeon]
MDLQTPDNPIVIRGLTKRFGRFKALDSLDLVVERNTFLGFLGPNGAGKTITIKILTNLLRASNGSAYLNGVDVIKNPKTALEGVGAVVETPEFYPYLTPEQILRYLGRLRGMPRRAIDARTDELLSLVKLEEWRGEKIGKFSKGMKQRLALAQALLHRPHVLILDEPTSGLDPRGMVEVRDILVELKKEQYTIFMSSHLLNEVQEVCDHVALIDHGRLLKSGSVAELLGDRSCRLLEVHTIDGLGEARLRDVSELAGVIEATKTGESKLDLLFRGDMEAQAELLDRLRELGLRISEFREANVALESLYLQLIKRSQ